MADKKKYSKLESGIRGAAETGTLGFADELEGAGMAAKDALNARSFAKLKEMLGPRINEARQAFSESQTENPNSYMAGQGAGIAASALVPGLGLANAGGKAFGAAKLLNTVKAGAGLGALTGVGYANMNEISPEEAQRVALEAGKGAVVGGVSAPLASAMAGKATSKFEKMLAELKPRAPVPNAVPQQTMEQVLQKLTPDDAAALNINQNAYLPEASELERVLGRRRVNSQLPPEAATLNVPSDTVKLRMP